MADTYYNAKIVLITGGAQGIGLGMAKTFAEAGAKVIITDADHEAGEESQNWLKQQGLEAAFIVCDVGEEEQVVKLLEQVAQQYKTLDVLINNAGIADPFIGGLEALTHSLAISLAKDNIRVNAIAPGWIETGNWQKKSQQYTPNHTKEDKAQHPAGRVGTPEDIAETALFLCSNKAGFITGQSLTIDGGMTVKMIYH